MTTTCLVVLCLSGCNPGAEKSSSKQPPKEDKGSKETPKKPRLIESAATGKGKGERVDPTTGSVLWTVNWERANLSFGTKGAFFGQMASVSGEVFQKGKKIGTYRAETGIADEKSNTLTLKGKVQFHSIVYQSDMLAGEVRYLPNQELIEAEGAVTVEGKSGFLGPLDALVATSDLRILGTPDSMKRFTLKGGNPKRASAEKRPTVQTVKQSHP
jgi:hypothetical protein